MSIGPFGMVVGVMGVFKEMVVETAKVFAGSDRQPDGRYGRINRATGMPSRAKPPGNGIPTPGVDFTIVEAGNEYARKNREEMQYQRTVRGRYLRKGDFANGDPDRRQQADAYGRQPDDEAVRVNRATRKHRRG
jgi:hypothetical protein